MPYNTNAISPREKPTGETCLPLSKVKKIISQDRDIGKCSTNAAFIMCVATEMFIQHMTREAHNNAKVDKKPRRNIQYQDLANAVAHQENLQFLDDVVPRAVPYKNIKAAAAARRAQLAGAKIGPGEWEEAADGSRRHKGQQGHQAKLLIHDNTTFSLRDARMVAPDPNDENEDIEMND